jgi:hyaluronoglucosaminidase
MAGDGRATPRAFFDDAMSPIERRRGTRAVRGSWVMRCSLVSCFTIAAVLPIALLPAGAALAVSHDSVYVANYSDNSVTPVDTTTDTAGAPIAVGGNPRAIAITSDGATAMLPTTPAVP